MRRGRPPYPDLLTPREQEVLQLLRQGLTNQQIADRLGISLYGARYHVSEILSKLGVSTREQAAAWRGERFWAFGLLGTLASKAGSIRWEGVTKATSIALLSGAAGIGVLLTLGAIIVLTSGDSSSTPSSSVSTPTAATPEDPRSLLPEYREYGPYRIAPFDYAGDTSTSPSPLAPLPSEQGQVAANLAEAQQSSLFPAAIPDGYDVIEANSQGQPSELLLHLVLEGPNGRVEIERSRPLQMPIDHRYDPSISDVQMSLLPRGFAIVPAGGDEDTPGVYVRGFEDGVDTSIAGGELSLDDARDLFLTMAGERGPATAERRLPDLDRTPDSRPRPEDITQTGPCNLDVVVTPSYIWRTSQAEVASRVACEDLVPLTTCDPGYVGSVPGLEVACDDRGYRIDASWDMNHDHGSCEGGGPVYVEGTTIMAATQHCTLPGGGSGTRSPVEVCVSIRDQETCARFEYVVP